MKFLNISVIIKTDTFAKLCTKSENKSPTTLRTTLSAVFISLICALFTFFLYLLAGRRRSRCAGERPKKVMLYSQNTRAVAQQERDREREL